MKTNTKHYSERYVTDLAIITDEDLNIAWHGEQNIKFLRCSSANPFRTTWPCWISNDVL
jgi:hypothetical protein